MPIAPSQTTPLSIAVPPGPADIAPDTSMADLRNIKLEWLRLAQNAGYTEMCWQVVQWLGEPVKIAGRAPALVCRLPNGVALVGHEHAERRLVRSSSDESQNAWLMQRFVTVWLENGAAEDRGLLSQARERGNVVDEIMFSSVMVAQLVWEYPGDGQPRLLDEQSTFLPGKWFNAILAALPDAKEQAQASGAETVETERRQLLSSLLAGRQI